MTPGVVPRGGRKLCPISIPPVFIRHICDLSVRQCCCFLFFKGTIMGNVMLFSFILCHLQRVPLSVQIVKFQILKMNYKLNISLVR